MNNNKETKPKYDVYRNRAEEVRAVNACREWLQGMKPSDKIYLKKTSYQYKHWVESAVNCDPSMEYLYVYDRTFTDEAAKAGFKVQRRMNPGRFPRFNFSPESVRQRQDEHDIRCSRRATVVRFDTPTRSRVFPVKATA